MVSDRWISASTPSIQRNRNIKIITSQTNSMTCGGALDKPTAPAIVPATPPPSEMTNPVTTARMVRTALSPPPRRDHWFRVKRQRSQSTVRNWLQFILGFQPTQLLPFNLVAAHFFQKQFLQRTAGADLFHRSLIHQPALRDDADIGAELL